MGNELTTTRGNAMAVYDRIQDPIAFAKEIATSMELLCGAPSGAGMAIGMMMLSENLNFAEVGRRYHFIGGRPSMRADAMLAEFRMNFGGDYEIIENSPTRAAIKFTDSKGREYEREFTLEQLNNSRWPWKNWKAEVPEYKDNYGTEEDRQSMLFNRLVSRELRRICPELVAGVYTPEELEDLPATEKAEKPARKTVAERLAGQEEPSARQRRPDTVVIDDAIDAEFTAAAPVDTPADPAAAGSIINRHTVRIAELFDLLRLTEAQRTQILARRNASVIRNLSDNQAVEILDRLEAMAKEKGVLQDTPAGE